MGKPGEGMPVTGMTRLKRPGQAFFRQSLPDDVVPDNIHVVIEKNEVMPENAGIHGDDSNPEEYRYENTSHSDLFTTHSSTMTAIRPGLQIRCTPPVSVFHSQKYLSANKTN